MKELVMSHEEILKACARIGSALTKKLKDEEKPPVFICVMKGAMNFMIDLIENVDMPIFVDYIQISSYEGSKSTGKINLKRDIGTNLEGRTAVIVEDVIDTGLSMKYLVEHLQTNFHPKQIIVTTLLDKAVARKVPVAIDYAGKVLNENKFVVGYGLDYKELHRNDPYIYVPTPEEVLEMDEAVAR